MPIKHDPVAAYDRIAPEYARISEERRAYLDGIERLVISHIPPGARSLLDIGAGDGTRTFRIVAAAGLTEFTLLEPSAGMRQGWPAGTPCWPIRAEELASRAGRFDVITCLWNVMGHVFPAESRVEVLRQSARLLATEGVLVLDVNHRYNARQYGLAPTLLRAARDCVFPGARNGDVTARWKVSGEICATPGHVFTDPEFRRLSQAAGLKILHRFSVDYTTGEIRRSKYSGSLLYVLQRAA